MSTYSIIVESTPDGGFGAWAPDLPGCIALGDSFEECVAEMQQAVTFHIDGLRAGGEPVPTPATRTATVDAA